MIKGGNTIIRNLLNLSISLFFLGVLFKIQHYPYSGIMLFTSCTAVFILYPIRFYGKQPKVLLDYLKLFLVETWIVSFIFRIQHYAYADVLGTVALVALVGVVIVKAMDYFKVRQ